MAKAAGPFPQETPDSGADKGRLPKGRRLDPTPLSGETPEEARRRAQRAQKRAARRRAARRADPDKGPQGKPGGPDGPPPPETPDWFKPPDQATLEKSIRAGIQSMRGAVAADLKARARSPDEKTEAEAFAAKAVVGDFELFLLSFGATGMIHKYQAWIARYAPELALGAGVCFMLATQLRLRREAKGIVARWKADRSIRPDGDTPVKPPADSPPLS